MEVGRLLRERGLTLAVAESCTGGLLGMRLTEVPGSSAYFRGGVVAYANAVKEGVLGVPAEVLARHGAVSAACARAMAEGVRRLLQADLALAITGIAGPSGGTPEKPVGLVYVALAHPHGVEVERHEFRGSRQGVRWSASEAALSLLKRFLEGR
ncbi:MAG: nicotinamide-nucleotide amidohydrolase family protein [Candidatus Bipolaricaulota bacterium]|nr:nicotinamide-nucleotide amidohydrolase family protein [Candidatus Bipolaricaulota bacterium]MDW8152254.1 nicotinamide-nucleotide amidohydrolase family protein [Candidatus Bipolaricaulota bacterium]